MDPSCIILTCLLLLQMIMILAMLNPMYDVRKMMNYINSMTKYYRRTYITAIVAYFVSVIFLGMYIPLQNIHRLIFCSYINEYEKLILLSRVEKSYVIAGFSLFLVVVLYAIKALLSYTASLMEITKRSEPLVLSSESKDESPFSNEHILPNLLRVKRSISYETILFANELKEQLKVMIKNIEFPQNRCTLTSILETTNLNVL